MEFILFRPPRHGLKVYYESPGGLPHSGVYTVIDTDEYNMAGMVVIEDSEGRGYGVSSADLEIMEHREEFKALALGVDADGATFLPSEKKLRDFGFTDHRNGYWHYSARVGSSESFNLTIPKNPIGYVLGEPVYSYTEGVIDEFFGQHAYFGKMKDQFRYSLVEKLSTVLKGLMEIGLLIRVHPEEYSWEGWPPGRPLMGHFSDGQTIEQLKTGFVYAISNDPVATEEGAESAPATVESPEAQEPIQEAAGDSLSEPIASDVTIIDADILKQVATAIDREAENFRWDSLATGMTMGDYVAPTAIRLYLEGIAAKEQD